MAEKVVALGKTMAGGPDYMLFKVKDSESGVLGGDEEIKISGKKFVQHLITKFGFMQKLKIRIEIEKE